jgi:hypothetical protein
MTLRIVFARLPICPKQRPCRFQEVHFSITYDRLAFFSILNFYCMKNFNQKGTKCPTLWQGVDMMLQNQALTTPNLPAVRPDTDDCLETEEKKNDSESDDSLSSLLGNIIGLISIVAFRDWLHSG